MLHRAPLLTSADNTPTGVKSQMIDMLPLPPRLTYLAGGWAHLQGFHILCDFKHLQKCSRTHFVCRTVGIHSDVCFAAGPSCVFFMFIPEEPALGHDW